MMETIVAGKKIEYGVDEKGTFKAEWNGERYEHVTLAGLKSALERQIKKKPINIRVIKIEHDHLSEKMDITKGVLVGVHSGNNNLLVKWDGDNQAEQVRHYRSELLRATTNIPKLKELYAKAMKARQDYHKFKESNAFDRHSIDKAEDE